MAHNNPIRDSVLQAIGNTPVVRLRKVVTSSMADVCKYNSSAASELHRVSIPSRQPFSARLPAQNRSSKLTSGSLRRGRFLVLLRAREV